MINVIKKILLQWVDAIDAGNSNLTEQEQEEIINLAQKINQKELNKLQSADYIGVCRATFDNYVKRGLIPAGKKSRGSNELKWNKTDLDKFLKLKW